MLKVYARRESASLEHACLQSLTKVLDSPCYKFLRKVIPDHIQSCATLLDCWSLTVFILSTRLQNFNADYLRYQFNSETCRRRYLTDAMVLSFNRMALQLTAHATQDWSHATAMTLLRSMNGHQTRQILICLIIMSGCYAENQSQAGYHKLDMLAINNRGASQRYESS